MSRLNVQPRRKFLQSITLGAAVIGAAGITAPIKASAGSIDNDDPEEWMKKINGKHRIVYDVTEPYH